MSSHWTWVDRNGDEEDIPVPPRVYRQPRVSPDGTRVAVAIVDGDNLDVWIWDLARETLTQLTFDEALDAVPLWTPDSARVVFASTRDGGGVFCPDHQLRRCGHVKSRYHAEQSAQPGLLGDTGQFHAAGLV